MSWWENPSDKLTSRKETLALTPAGKGEFGINLVGNGRVDITLHVTNNKPCARFARSAYISLKFVRLITAGLKVYGQNPSDKLISRKETLTLPPAGKGGFGINLLRNR